MYRRLAASSSHSVMVQKVQARSTRIAPDRSAAAFRACLSVRRALCAKGMDGEARQEPNRPDAEALDTDERHVMQSPATSCEGLRNRMRPSSVRAGVRMPHGPRLRLRTNTLCFVGLDPCAPVIKL